MIVVIESVNSEILRVRTFRDDLKGLDLAFRFMRELIVEDIMNDDDNAVLQADAEKWAARYCSSNTDDRVRGNIVYQQHEYFDGRSPGDYRVTLVPKAVNGHEWVTGKRFKVAAISSNLGSFGHKGHILIAEDGHAIEGDRQPNSINRTVPDLKVGDVLELTVNADGDIVNWHEHCFEFIKRRTPDAPPSLVREVWAVAGELVQR